MSKEEITVEELKDFKCALEENIASELKRFEKDTGTKVESVNIERHMSISTRPEINCVGIEIKI